MNERRTADGGEWLPPDLGSLAYGVPASAPGMIYALSLEGGVAFAPKEGRSVLFGRNKPDVHVCIGGNDRSVSREHGRVTWHAGHWWVSTTGGVPVRLPGSRLVFGEDDRFALPAGYTPMFVRGSRRREHLLEVFVVGESGHRPADAHSLRTDRKVWRLSPQERLALVALAQRYLMHEEFPQPLTRQDAADALNRVDPAGRWTEKKVDHVVTAVRGRLSRDGVRHLTRAEVGEPVGNTLNHNLITELLSTATLVPPDLRLVEED